MKQHILAVDDEIHMLELLERIITEKTPYQITTTNNSLEVPNLLDKTQFDLIIADLKMPGMDGIDILSMVKERQREEEVIIITAFGSLESAIKALSLGVFDYITKPFKKEQIIYTVDRAMRWQKMKREIAYMSDIFEREPYEEAVKAFKFEYLRRLAERTGKDKEMMVKRSGLPMELIVSVMNKEELERK